MNIKKKCNANSYVSLLAGSILLVAVFGVQAATTVEWTNTGSSDYNIAANWAGGTVPQGTGYNPDVTNGGTVMISGSDPTWAVNNLQAGDGSGNSGTFSQSGGTASCDQWLRLGQGSGGTGTYMMSGGTFTDGNGSHGQVNIGEAGSGTFTVSGGTVNLTGTFSGAGGANGGGTGGTGTINLSGAGAISVSGAGNGGPFELGYSGNGMMIQTGGSLTDTKTSSSDSYVWCLGGGTSGTGSSIGIYNMSAGTFGCSNNFWCGGYGNGEMNVSGTASATISGGGSGSSYPAIGRQAGSFGILDISGGTLACTGSHTIQVSQSGTGTLNVRGGTATFNGMQVASSSGGIGIVNINGGTLAISGANNISEAASTGTGTLNFNGGTLQAGGANSTFITGLNNAYIFSGGATIDSQTYAITIPQALKTPSGNGVTGIPVATGGVGYQVPPIVKISSGGGSGATAIATISGGAVTGITIICSGTGYTSAPTVTLTGGGYTTAATIGTVTYGANSSGGLTKIGSGTLTLTAADTYTGSTTVSAGTLALSGSGAINSSSGINVAAGGTFDVSGTGANYTIPGTLTASGTASAATIKGGSGKTVAANSGITLTYDGSDPALTISQGTLSLNGNTFTVNGSVLATGSYNIISQTSGNITGSGSYSVTGTAIPAAGATVSVVGGNVVLQVNSGVSYSGYIITGSGSMTAGGSQTITVSAVDTSGATVTGVSGNIFLTFSGLNSSPDFTAPTVGGTAVGSPVSLSFVSGQATATLQVYDAQSATLAVTDGTHSTISTGGAGLGLIISSGSASTTAVQTAASGGVNVSAQNVSSGSSITVYAVSADAYGNSLGNVAATWSLSTKTGGVANGDLLASGDAKSATLTGHLAGTAVIQAVAGSFTGQSGTLTVIAGSASQTTVETAANGTGSVVGTQNITAGNSITGYAISRDAAGNFVGNVAATWSLQNITGGVANGDLLASGETNNATFTGHLEGTAVIQAVAGGFAGQSGTLTVLPGPPIIVTGPQSQVANPSQTVQFGVVATGTQPLSYQWESNSVVISGATSTNLVLTNITAASAATYTVVVTNYYGTNVASATLTVLSNTPPVIVTGPQSQVANLGQTVQFSVVATGAQPLSYQWKSNSVSISGATSANLVLANLSSASAATYTVVVTNSYGKVSSNATLTVCVVTNFYGWGTSLCWWANVVGGYANWSVYADAAFTQLKLNIIRYNIGGGENPNIANTMQYRAQMQGFEPSPGVWNWNADANQRLIMKAAVARGANLIEAFANSPPWWMTVSGSVTGSKTSGANNLQTSYETNFASYLAIVVSNLTVLDGVKFDFVTPMNEPTAGWWNYGNNQEGCNMSAAQQVRVVNDLDAALNSNGLDVGIDASEDNTEAQTVNSINAYGSATNNVSLITTHTYTANNAAGIYNLSKSMNVPAWISEYGDGDGSGLTMAQAIHDDIIYTGASAWIYWQFVDSASGWGMWNNSLSDETHTSYAVNEKFYTMWQFSNFIRPGSQILATGQANTVMAYNQTNQTLAIVTVNNTGNSFNITNDLTAFASVGNQAQCYQTSSSKNGAMLSPVSIVNKQFVGTMASDSVTTYSISGVVLTAIIEPTLSYTYVGGSMVLTYAGTLLSSTNVNGPFIIVGGATSPYTVPLGTGTQMYYRTYIP